MTKKMKQYIERIFDSNRDSVECRTCEHCKVLAIVDGGSEGKEEQKYDNQYKWYYSSPWLCFSLCKSQYTQ